MRKEVGQSIYIYNCFNYDKISFTE